MDPYKILGVSPSATDDEVKKAYRRLSKKYHPDANRDNANQEDTTKMFMQVQDAYKMIMNGRKNGFQQQGYQSYQGNQSYSYSNQYAGNDQALYNQVAQYIQLQRYQEAMNMLDSIKNKSSVWFYYAALVQHGLRNDIAAVDLAKTAVQMEPNNLQFILLLQQLQGSQGQYRRTQQSYGGGYDPMRCCMSICYLNMLMSCCCGC